MAAVKRPAVPPSSGAGETESLDEMSLSSFQEELAKRQDEAGEEDAAAAAAAAAEGEEEGGEFDGYALRDAIYEKWGECFDVDFQRVDSYGVRSVYLVSCNIGCYV